jgi:hypothetical protein
VTPVSASDAGAAGSGGRRVGPYVVRRVDRAKFMTVARRFFDHFLIRPVRLSGRRSGVAGASLALPYGMSRGPGGLFIDREDVLYVADSLSMQERQQGQERSKGWKRGIRIGSARDGAVTAFIPDPTPDLDPITAPEAVAADADGNVFGAVVPARRLLKYVRRQTAR